MSDLYYRTEDVPADELLALFVENAEDRLTINSIKAPSPMILEGSRGTGKSFLMRVAEAELRASFDTDRVLPVYVSFLRSSLLSTSDPVQFRHWMLARTCGRIVRQLAQFGLTGIRQDAIETLTGSRTPLASSEPSPIEEVSRLYEESWRNPGESVNASIVPDVEDFRDAVEDVCTSAGIQRVCLLFDEAAHVLRPEQQRQFFTLFRDLRASFISCNAAVYPGLTSYGESFELAHDATLRKLARDVTASSYLENMREIVERQADAGLLDAMARQRNQIDTLAYAATGNPRFLLKLVAKAPTLRSSDVEDGIKRFFRQDIWSEHSSLAERFAGHRPLIDWGRDFIERQVLPDTQQKNSARSTAGKEESTAFFWIHRDAPEAVKEALRLLEYTGIVQRQESGIRGTRSELGTRYLVNLGCVLALEAKPTTDGLAIARNLSIKRFTEYGSNHEVFAALRSFGSVVQPDIREVLSVELAKSIDVLDITPWQRDRLKEAGFIEIGQILDATEENIMSKIHYVGPKRARRVRNAALSAILEYLSG